MRTLQGKRVLITGAATGIGRSLALRFAEEGARLLLTDIDEEQLRVTGEDLRTAGHDVWEHPLDVTDTDQIHGLHDAVHRQGGPIDVLVNNAGVVFGGPFLAVPLEQHLATYRVNILGPVMLTHAFLMDLIGGEDGHLVNVASAAGYLAVPRGTTYASSKWAVLGFSESIAAELAGLGVEHVHVTVVCPSYVSTGMFEGATPPLLTPWITPQRVAEETVAAVLHNRTHVRTPFMVKTAPVLKGLLPEFGFNALTQVLGINSGMQSWRGHAGEREAAGGTPTAAV